VAVSRAHVSSHRARKWRPALPGEYANFAARASMVPDAIVAQAIVIQFIDWLQPRRTRQLWRNAHPLVESSRRSVARTPVVSTVLQPSVAV